MWLLKTGISVLVCRNYEMILEDERMVKEVRDSDIVVELEDAPVLCS